MIAKFFFQAGSLCFHGVHQLIDTRLTGALEKAATIVCVGKAVERAALVSVGSRNKRTGYVDYNNTLIFEVTLERQEGDGVNGGHRGS